MNCSIHLFTFLSLIIMILRPMGLLAQDVEISWVQSYSSDLLQNNHRARAMAVDTLGNVYVTGGSYDSTSNYDYATIKYNPDGSEAWVNRYNGPGNDYDYAYALAVDRHGNVYVTGSSDGASTNRDYATIKYNPNGSEAWVSRYNGMGDHGNHGNYPSGLAVDGAGNVYVTGSSYDSTSNDDYATIKYYPDGSEAWVSRYNGPGNGEDGASALAVDAEGNLYVTGESWGLESRTDYATIKYNPDGSEAWVSRYNGPANDLDNAYALAVDGAGNVYVTGYSSGLSSDYATIKYFPDGTEAWVSRYNGPGNYLDYGNALAVDELSNVYVTGRSHSADWEVGGDYATIKYNPDGSEAWVSRYNGPGDGDDGARALAVDGAGNVYVTGSSYDSTSNDDYATIKYYPDGTEAWVSRYTELEHDYWGSAIALAVDGLGNVYVTGTTVHAWDGEGEFPDPGYSVYTTIKYNQPSYPSSVRMVSQLPAFRLNQNYPNPFNPMTTIQYSLPEAGLVNLKIFDIRGQEVAELLNDVTRPGNYEVQWNGMDQQGNPVSTGVYFARLQAGEYNHTIKMLYLK